MESQIGHFWITCITVADVTRADIERFRNAVAEGKTATRIKTGRYGLARVNGGKGTATRTLGLLGAIFGYSGAARDAAG